MSKEQSNLFLDKFMMFAQKVGNQMYLKSLRDTFATLMGLFILAGISILINCVFLDSNGFMKSIISAETMVEWQAWGNIINNITLNVAGLMLAVTFAYFLARNKEYSNPIGVVVAVVPCFLALVPLMIEVVPNGVTEAVSISGILSYAHIGSKGIFAAIIAGILGTELYLFLTKSKKLRINLGENIPPAVANSFNTMIPLILTVSIFAFASFLIQRLGTDFMSLIERFIQEPLRGVNTSLPGYLLIMCLANLLFSFGIHQSVLTGSLLDPLLLVNMNENMLAFSNGEPIPHIINGAFHQIYGGLLGGSGTTLGLILAIFVFSKYKAYRDIAKLGLAPNLFNINEPIIFGLPIVFNVSLIIPFVLSPIIGTVIGYLATSLGLVNHCVVAIPWTAPPFISGYLATAGDWRAPIVQLIIIVLTALWYLPFLKISERIAKSEVSATNIE